MLDNAEFAEEKWPTNSENPIYRLFSLKVKGGGNLECDEKHTQATGKYLEIKKERAAVVSSKHARILDPHLLVRHVQTLRKTFEALLMSQ